MALRTPCLLHKIKPPVISSAAQKTKANCPKAHGGRPSEREGRLRSPCRRRPPFAASSGGDGLGFLPTEPATFSESGEREREGVKTREGEHACFR
jgi:hypothetical protein